MIAILSGPPGSGKTTLATRLHRRLEERGYAFDLLHSDGFDRRPYDAMYEMVAGTDADWILDGTFYRREWRDRFRALDDTYLVWVNVAREVAMTRNRDRRDPIPEKGLHVMHSVFEPPDADLRLDTHEITVDEATARLESAVTSWVEGTHDRPR